MKVYIVTKYDDHGVAGGHVVLAPNRKEAKKAIKRLRGYGEYTVEDYNPRNTIFSEIWNDDIPTNGTLVPEGNF